MPSERKTSTTAESKNKDSVKNLSDNAENTAMGDNIQMPVQQDMFEAVENATELDRMPTIIKESILIPKVAPTEEDEPSQALHMMWQSPPMVNIFDYLTLKDQVRC